jgi:hypothetical protein
MPAVHNCSGAVACAHGRLAAQHARQNICSRACALPALAWRAHGDGYCAGHGDASLRRRTLVMDVMAMVMNGARQSLTGTRDDADDTAVPAPRGGGLAVSGDLHVRRQGHEVVRTEKDHGGGGARLTLRRMAASCLRVTAPARWLWRRQWLRAPTSAVWMKAVALGQWQQCTWPRTRGERRRRWHSDRSCRSRCSLGQQEMVDWRL